MEHFSSEDWADFVRGVAADRGKNIASHLANGCRNCVAEFDIWNRFRSNAANDLFCAPPEALVRRLKLELSAQHARQEPSARLAQMVFDSFAQPLPVGVRSGMAVARQLIYEGEGLTVDLRVQREPRTNKVCAVGQVLDKRVPHSSPSQGTVILWTSQGYPAVQTNPNEQGEFQFEFEAQNRLHLSIAIPGRSPLRIAFPELEASSLVSTKVTDVT